MKIDSWVWGNEKVIWGYDRSHKYTLKVLEPKVGRAGCLSLQYHLEKSETWIGFRGKAWALAVIGEEVATTILETGSVLPLPAGTIHRLMGVTDDCQIIEPSTPDRHAADKSVTKDVIRLHCVLGREAVPPRDDTEAGIVKRCIELTEEAISFIESGRLPNCYNAEAIKLLGASSL